MKKFFLKLIKNAFVINFLLAVVFGAFILWVGLTWIDRYTQHNQAVQIPDVKGLTIDKAGPFLVEKGLKYNVIDSVYVKTMTPGAIVELLPRAGDKVKKGRIVFITINALSVQMATIPSVNDLSYRQALALLKAAGFENITIKSVPGIYKHLAVGIEINGVLVEKKQKESLSVPITLLVSTGNPEETLGDSLGINDNPIHPLNSEEEKWF